VASGPHPQQGACHCRRGTRPAGQWSHPFQTEQKHQNKQARPTASDRGERSGARTTPTLTLSGDWSARKASVTPRMGSLAAGSTWPNSDDICLAGCRLASWGRRLKEDTVRDSAAMPGRGTEEQRYGGRKGERAAEEETCPA
jgi:hypothetical protein